MAISKEKLAKKTKSKAYIKEQREIMLAKSGYTALKEKHGKSANLEIPNYKVTNKHQLSNLVSPNGFKRKSNAEHPDAIKFPIYEAHKSNPVLQLNFDGRLHSGGKKT